MAVSREAAICLDRGISLSEASEASEKLISKSGANAALAALQSPDVSSRWTALEALAKQYDLALPKGDNRTERAARRIQRAVQRRKLRQAREVSAKDFQLDASFWLSMDAMPVPILSRVELHYQVSCLGMPPGSRQRISGCGKTYSRIHCAWW